MFSRYVYASFIVCFIWEDQFFIKYIYEVKKKVICYKILKIINEIMNPV